MQCTCNVTVIRPQSAAEALARPSSQKQIQQYAVHSIPLVCIGFAIHRGLLVDVGRCQHIHLSPGANTTGVASKRLARVTSAELS